jgi:hypothetical protein
VKAPNSTARLRAAVFALVAAPTLLLAAGCAAGYGGGGPDVGVDYYAPYGGDYGFYGDGGYNVGPYGWDRGGRGGFGHGPGRGGGGRGPSIPGGGHGFGGGGGHMGGGGGGGHGGGGHR